jgi:peroxiredoxin family protein
MAESERKKRIALIASKGTLDMAYPPLILATTAVAMDMEAAIFFTFYGLNIIRKGKYQALKVAPLANPAMPMPVPNLVGAIPGMTAMATSMMKSMMSKANVATLGELLEIAVESGVRLIGCQMTMDVFGLSADELIDGVEVGGAATFLNYAADADISLFI